MYNVIILANEIENDCNLWIEACNKFDSQLEYRIVNLTHSNWLEEIQKKHFDIMLVKPPAYTVPFKQLYDERLSILVRELGYKSYPKLEEVLIYENKRYLSYWLIAKQIPHPNTSIFYNKLSALDYLQECKYPIVGKLSIGASGNGVRIIKNYKDAIKYVNRIFAKGIISRTGPRFDRRNYISRLIDKLKDLEEFKKRLMLYRKISNDPQKGFCIFQEFIPHKFEWRVVCIGNSYFAHKKIVKSSKASGSLIKSYEKPPLELLDFVKNIMDETGFYSQAIDIFEKDQGVFLVNEMQCIFGQSDPHQMIIDGKPGRYIYKENNWVFEHGNFNSNESYDLRIQHILTLLSNGNN